MVSFHCLLGRKEVQSLDQHLTYDYCCCCFISIPNWSCYMVYSPQFSIQKTTVGIANHIIIVKALKDKIIERIKVGQIIVERKFLR